MRKVKRLGADSYPLLVLVTFGRNNIEALYYKLGDYPLALTEFLDSEDKRGKRIRYKQEKRMIMQSEPDFDYQAWQERVERWKNHLEISEAIRKQEEQDSKHSS